MGKGPQLEITYLSIEEKKPIMFGCLLQHIYKNLMTNNIEIPIDKTRTALLLIVPVLILGAGILSIISPETLYSPDSNDFEKFRLLAMAGGVIGLFLTIQISRKWLFKKTGFIIDESGITDLTNASYTGLVEWQDITKVEKKKVGPIKMIILHINNPEKYIKQARKTSIRQMKKNLKFYGSPILIVSSRLKIKYEDLAVLITKEFEKTKSAKT